MCSDILPGIYSDILSDMLSGLYSDTLSIFVAFYLAFYLASIPTFFLTFYLTYMSSGPGALSIRVQACSTACGVRDRPAQVHSSHSRDELAEKAERRRI